MTNHKTDKKMPTKSTDTMSPGNPKLEPARKRLEEIVIGRIVPSAECNCGLCKRPELTVARVRSTENVPACFTLSVQCVKTGEPSSHGCPLLGVSFFRGSG